MQPPETLALPAELRDDVLRYADANGMAPQDAVNHLIKAGLAQLQRSPAAPPASNQ